MPTSPARLAALSLALALPFTFVASIGHADEGMWTFDNVPRAEIGKRYGFTPDDAWLEHVRLGSARLAGGTIRS